MIEQFIRDERISANGIVGLFPANSLDDDIIIYTDETRKEERARLYGLRQQSPKLGGKKNMCLSDYIAPADSGLPDYIGAFAVTAGMGLEELVAEFEAEHDDYRVMMAKALADRFAEAFAECMHAMTRRELWGYAAAENWITPH